MALDQTPWMIGGGAEHSAGIARSISYAATGGKEGIASPGDFKISAQSVPNGTVRALAGVATLLNTYAGGAGQAYVAKNLSQTHITIQPTGSSGGRSDLIVLSVVDPEFEGSEPEDPNNFNYTRLEVISGVPSSTRGLSGIDFPRPGIPLARIDIPASTGTITSGMIKDLRFLANPRSEQHLLTYALTQDGDGYDELNYRVASKPEGEAFPNHFWHVDIPEWATGVQMRGMLGQVRIPGLGVNNWGRLFVRIGTIANGFSSQTSNWDLDSSKTGITRESYMFADDRSVPSQFRGTTQQVYIRGTVINNNKNVPRLDAASSISVDLRFYEDPI